MSRVAQFYPVRFKVLHLSRVKTLEKCKKTCGERFAKRDRIKRAGCEVRYSQKDPLVLRLFTNANYTFIALTARSTAIETVAIRDAC